MHFKNAKIIGDGIDPEVYHRQDAKRGDMDFVISNSQLVNFRSGQSRWKRGYREIDEEKTKSLEWGSLLDVMWLDPDRFDEKYIIPPEVYPCKATKSDPRTEKPWHVGAQYCKDWAADQGGKKVIKQEKLNDAKEAIKRLDEDEIIRELFDTAKKQVMIVAEYHDKDTGLIIPVKGLLDMLMPTGAIADFKTCKSAHPLAWPSQVDLYSYDMQAAFFKDLYDAATGNEREELFSFIQSENCFPWETGRKWLSVEFETIGRDKYTAALKLYCQCLSTKTWPGYDDGSEYGGWSMTAPKSWMI